jgi:hypothetical protein
MFAMTRAIVTKPSVCCAVSLATTLLAGSASAQYSLFHSAEFPDRCINLVDQNAHNGLQIAINQHCDKKNPTSVWYLSNYYKTISSSVFDFSDCIDNRPGYQSNGSPIVIWRCNGGGTQEWDWDGTFFRYHANPSKCLSIDWGGKIGDTGFLGLWDCLGANTQRFVQDTLDSRDVIPWTGVPGEIQDSSGPSEGRRRAGGGGR